MEPDRKKGMMDLLMEVENENGEKLEDEHIIDLLLLILFAGHETTAHTAMWAIIYLHDHPEMLQKAKVRDETGVCWLLFKPLVIVNAPIKTITQFLMRHKKGHVTIFTRF